MTIPPTVPSASPPQPQGGVPRRTFLRLSSTLLGGLVASRLPAVAGPFTREDFTRLVPEDKKLSPEWVQSLFARGTPAVYRGGELEKIGMPIGGIGCGQVYLGGDGKLWHWDIFNHHVGTGAEHYAHPLSPESPFAQGFALRVITADRTETLPLDRTGWRDISFNGEYPIAHVEYRDAARPVHVSLESFSPFVPLDVMASSLPVTAMRFTVQNPSPEPVQVGLAGWLQNPVCLRSGPTRDLRRRNRVARREGLVALECRAEAVPDDPKTPLRADISFEDFEREAYESWTTTGDAFGTGPVEQGAVPAYQGNLGMHGRRAVNSHATAPGSDVGSKDARTGTLTSPPFKIERNYITFLVGGGAHPGTTCVELQVNGEAVLSATGRNDNHLAPVSWDVRRWAGQTARLRVVDQERGGWGNIGLDDIVFSDRPRMAPGPLAEEPDFGSMTLALLKSEVRSPESEVPREASNSPTEASAGRASQEFGIVAFGPGRPEVAVFERAAAEELSAQRPANELLIGGVGRTVTLAPGQSATWTFLLTWHFPNLRMDRLPPGRHYGTRFGSALEVAAHVTQHFETLREATRRWHDTWYDSTLPYWFLDRTFLNVSILATSTCFRFANGRFYGWEGVGCCPGTCGHVWQYAHAMARLFPELERDTRERVDFGLALQPDGAIFFRAEFNDIPALDAQAGTVLRALREHQMTTDNAWLQRNWPGIRRATEWLMAKDGDGDGLITGNQHNTLDTDWYGLVAWLSGLYLAALRAGEEMARIVGDEAFAVRCRGIFERGRTKLVSELFDGEYFINRVEPQHADAINSGTGCHIDQVFGQSWAYQVGLGRILPPHETVSALRSLWRYNFTPDVGPYRAEYKPGRWYAMPGEGGLLMCSFPRRDWDYAQAKGKGPDWAAGYFNECMNGFEYQAAGHMIAEGLVLEGLAVTRMIHDRYHPSRRNPWNEVECGDHYARSMASHGVYLVACGYEYDGPRGRLAFAPRLTPEDFRCAFTAAEGWGTFAQLTEPGRQRAEVILRWGRLRLTTLGLGSSNGPAPAQARVTVDGVPLASRVEARAGGVEVRFAEAVQLAAGQVLHVELA